MKYARRNLTCFAEINGRLVEVMSLGRVMYDFDPQSPQELGLRVGQTVNIISKPDGENGWWKGEYQSRVSTFLFSNLHLFSTLTFYFVFFITFVRLQKIAYTSDIWFFVIISKACHCTLTTVASSR